MAVVLICFTAFLAFQSISPQKRRRVAKKARRGVSQVVATVYEGDLSNLPRFERIGRRLGLVTGPMPQKIAASDPERKKSTGDPETAKIQRQMDELMESMEGFTGTSAAGRPLAPGAKPRVRPQTGRPEPGLARTASRGTARFPAAFKQLGADAAGASERRIGGGSAVLRGGAGMSRGYARQFDSMRFQNKPSAPAAQGQDPPYRAGPMLGNAFSQADALKGLAAPAAPSTAARAPLQEQVPSGGLFFKAAQTVDEWLVRLGLGESVFVKFLRKATGSSPTRPRPAAPGPAGPAHGP